ncbi:MAG: sigma-70 family RNA polymerase sigma factor [Bacteroidota bacterium]
MATLNLSPQTHLTVHQFAEYFFPSLVEKLRADVGLALRDALHISHSIIHKLKGRFKRDIQHPIPVFQKALAIIVDKETRKYRILLEKNFGLSEAQFIEMQKQLQEGDESLFEHIFMSHFDTTMTVLKRKHRASHQDAYDATMNAMLIFCRKLKQGDIQYGNLQFLFIRIATHRFLNWIKRQGKTEAFTEFDISEELPVYDEETYELLGQAFAKLGDGCRDLLNAFYYSEQTLQQVSEQTQRSYAAIRKQKQRCMEKLRGFFNQLK